MNHEQYTKTVAACPLERYRAQTKLQHECPEGHRIVATPEAMLDGKMCAWCEGYELDEVLPVIHASGFTLAGRIGKRIMLDRSGLRHMFHIEDLINGLVPGELVKTPGMYLYYMKLKSTKDELLYKIGVSRNPYKRLSEFKPTLLWFSFYDREDTARREEAALKKRFAQYKRNDPFALKQRNGYTELFTIDVLGLDK